MIDTFIQSFINVLAIISLVLIPIIVVTLKGWRDIKIKIHDAKLADSEGGEKITINELIEIIEESNVIVKRIFNLKKE